MANFNIHFEPGGEREALVQFLDQTVDFMIECLTEYRFFFLPYFHEGLGIAFEEYKKRHEEVKMGVRELKDKVLEDHLLTGASLRVKFQIVDVHHRDFLAAPRKGWKVRALRKLFDAINTVLKSALDSVPGGGGLVEIKECFENTIDD